MGDTPVAHYTIEYYPGGSVKKRSTEFLHTDHLATPRLATDDTGTAVWRWEGDAFGQDEPDQDVDGDGENIVINLRFPGQIKTHWAETFYNYFRDYDPTTGRYVQSDPIGLAGGLNTYAYVGGNPLFWVDPLGLRGTRGAWRRSSSRTRGNRGGGRAGFFGCLGVCVSLLQGEKEAEISISPTFGGGFMICPSKPKPKNVDQCTDEDPQLSNKDCGIYDPNCDNNAQPSISVTRGGAGLGLTRMSDETYCVMGGPFVSFPLISLSVNIGGFGE